jgi:aerobic carbon-monoxide dehydrogenase large subunit
MSARLFGQPVRRVEDPAMLRGAARFLDDLPAGEALHLAVVRSTVAHGRVDTLDAGEALALPGVVAVATAADLGPRNGPFPHPTWFPPSDRLRAAVDPLLLRPELLRVLAGERVRYAGEPIAAVLAGDPYTAADATELVEVDLDPLPAVAGMDAALDPDAPLLNPEWGDNLSAHFTVRKGDAGRALREAAVVVRDVFTFARQTGAPLEPRGALAIPDPESGRLTVWSSTQAPHWLRKALATFTGMEAERIRVVAPDVGGGFGIKSMVYPEELLVALLALRLERPVKWVETRSEHFLGAVHSRDQRHQVELALDPDGRIAGLRDRYMVDVGASNVEGLVVPYNTAAHLQGAYRVPALEIDCRCVVTNKTPLSAYRGAGRPEAVFAMERILDRAARELGIDPVELRRRNLLGAGEMPYDAGIPYRDGSALVLDAGDVAGGLDLAVREGGYDGWRRRQAELREVGRHLGIGVATYVEGTGIGPGELAEARVEPSGQVRITVALPSQGQGHATTLAQICADELSVGLEDVRLVQGDTQAMATGGGTIASRTAVVVGNAVGAASRGLREALLRAGAEALEAAPDDLELRDGRVRVRGAPSRSLSLADAAAAAAAGDGDGLAAAGGFTPPGVTFASGAHFAVVEVDPWTGSVRVLRYLVVHDCGRVINPMIVEAQVAGGVAQGIGGALLEELVYDEDGQLLTGSFMDYLLPRSTGLPAIEVLHLETPSLRNPLGIKGVGEAGTIGPPAAIAGAIEDALAPFGARVTRCPLPPHVVAGLVPDHALACCTSPYLSGT